MTTYSTTFPGITLTDAVTVTSLPANPGGVSTLWYSSGATAMMAGASALMLGATSPVTDKAVVRFSGTGGASIQNSLLTVSDLGLAAGAIGLQMTATTANPGTATTLWFDSLASNALKVGSSGITLGPASSTDRAVPRFNGAGGSTLLNSLLTVSDLGLAAGAIGLQLTATTANPGTATTLWFDSLASNIPKLGASPVVVGPATSTNTAIALFNGTGGSVVRNSVVTVNAGGDMSGIRDILTTGNLETSSIRVTNATGTIYIQSAITKVAGSFDPITFSPYGSITDMFHITSTYVGTGTGIALRASQAPSNTADVARLADISDQIVSLAPGSLSNFWNPGGSGTPIPPSTAATLYYGKHGRMVYLASPTRVTISVYPTNPYEQFGSNMPSGYRPTASFAEGHILMSLTAAPYTVYTEMIYINSSGNIFIYGGDGGYIAPNTLGIIEPFVFWFFI